MVCCGAVWALGGVKNLSSRATECLAFSHQGYGRFSRGTEPLRAWLVRAGRTQPGRRLMCRAVHAPRHVPLPRRTSSTADVYYDRPRPTALAAEYKFIALRFSLRTPHTLLQLVALRAWWPNFSNDDARARHVADKA